MTRARKLIVVVVLLVAVAILVAPAVLAASRGSSATSPSGVSNATSPQRTPVRAETSAVDPRLAEHLECSKRRAALVPDPSL